MRYLCLGYHEDATWRTMPADQRKALIDENAAYQEILRKNGHYLDVNVYGTLNFTNSIGVQGGYRSVDVGYHVDSDTGSFVLRGIYFGVVARY